MEPYKVSVIMPVYDAEEYLPAAMDSILGQTLENLEFICVEDQSTDDSMKILMEYAKRDSRVKILQNDRNYGAYFSRNRALEIATGEYIYFMDSDDWIDVQALEKLYEDCEKNKLDIIYFELTCEYESEEIKKIREFHYERHAAYEGVYDGQDLFAEFVKNRDTRVNLPGAFFRHEFIKKHQLHFVNGTNHKDDLFYFQSILTAKRVKCISTQYYHRRVRADSCMTARREAKHIYMLVGNIHDMYLFALNHPLREKTLLAVFRLIQGHYGMLIRLCHEVSRETNLSSVYCMNPFYDAIFRSAMIESRVMKDEGMNLRSALPEYFPLKEPELDFLSILHKGLFQSLAGIYRFPFHLFPRCSKIILYGFGIAGRVFYQQVESLTDYVKIVGVVDDVVRREKTSDVFIYPIENMKRMLFDYILITDEDKTTAMKKKKQLVLNGFLEKQIKWDGDSYRSVNFYRNVYFEILSRTM